MPLGRFAFLVPALALASAFMAPDPRAQSRVELGRCTEESRRPSFAPTDANRLTANAFQTKIVGQRLVFHRMNIDPPAELRHFLLFRPDGSLAQGCDMRLTRGLPHMIRDWRPCGRMTDEGGSRDVGAWRIADPKGLVCIQRAGKPNERDRENCFTFHESGGQFAIRHASGLGRCLPGDFAIQPPGG